MDLIGLKNGKTFKNDSFSVIVKITSRISNNIHEELDEIVQLFKQKSL
jgi:hypothetical protein